MIDTILFDLDDTLLDFSRDERAALSDTLLHFGITPSEEIIEEYIRINVSCWKRLERGEWTRKEVLIGRFAELYALLGRTVDPSETQSYYEERLSKEGSYIPGATELLDSLSGSYRLYAVSNGNTLVQDGRIAITGIDRYFGGIFISERVGADKPKREFFDRVFAEIGGSRDRCVIVGDSLTSDVLGGINAGIHTVYYNPREKTNDTGILPEYEIRSLCELTEILEKL